MKKNIWLEWEEIYKKFLEKWIRAKRKQNFIMGV
jgi:hypothetical protein